MQERQGRLKPCSSKPGLRWAFLQPAVNLCVLPGPSESVMKLWAPSQDTSMSLTHVMFRGHLLGSQTLWDLSMGPRMRKPFHSPQALRCAEMGLSGTASGGWEEGRASRLLQAYGSKAKARGRQSARCGNRDSAMCGHQSELPRPGLWTGSRELRSLWHSHTPNSGGPKDTL